VMRACYPRNSDGVRHKAISRQFIAALIVPQLR